MFLHEGASSLIANCSSNTEYTQSLCIPLKEVEVGHEVCNSCHVTKRQLVFHLQKLLKSITPLLVGLQYTTCLKGNCQYWFSV